MLETRSLTVAAEPFERILALVRALIWYLKTGLNVEQKFEANET